MSFKIKDALLIGCLALLTTWTIEYFLLSKKGTTDASEQRSGQSFIAADTPQDLRPLTTEVDFSDEQLAHRLPVEQEIVETEGARFTFTNQGGTLERLEFKRELRGKPSVITTIFPAASTDFEDRCFLVAFDEKTLFNYIKTDRSEDADTVTLTYQATDASSKVQKKFTLYKALFKIDLDVTVEPLSQDVALRPRIFYPAPIMPDIASSDVIAGIVVEERGRLITVARNKVDTHQGWYAPSLFGVQNKYFVHSMVTDPTHFTQRAYYYLVGQDQLYAILEGPNVTTTTAWHLSFYFGPKESSALAAVDQRLEHALDYAGWFAPISRALLAVLMLLFAYLGNYGVAIIVLTLLVRLALWPLAIKSSRAMKEGGKGVDMKKKLRYIEERYKHDPETLARERAALMRQHSATFVSGCLPLLLQLPIMYALNRALASSIVLYGASFLWIPDLSASDPYYILPLLITISMLLQATTVDPQQRTTMIIAGLMFGALSVSLSSGLTLYLGVSMLIAALQSFIQQKMRMV